VKTSIINWIKRHAYWLKWVFSLGLLIVVLLKIEWSTLVSALLLVSWWYYPLALLLVLFAQVLATWRWKLFLPDDRFWTLFRFNLIAQFYAFSLPSALSGDVMKVVHMKNNSQSKSYYAATVYMDKLLGLLALFIFLSIATFNSEYTFYSSLFWPCAGISVSIFCLIMAIKNDWVKNLIIRFLHLIGLKRLDSFIEAIHSLKKNWKAMLLSLILSFGFQLAFVSIYALCEYFLQLNLSFFDYLICVSTAQIVTMLPLSIAGLGLKDVSFIYLLSIYNVTNENALALSLIYYPLLLLTVIAGYIYLLKLNRTI